MPTRRCIRFAQILESKPSVVNGVCTATRIRSISPRILGRSSRSPLAVAAMFSYEKVDRKGRALCLGETVILSDEINPFVTELRRRNIKVTAIHNHWLFERPRLMYIHFEAIEKPLVFAAKVRRATQLVLANEI